MESLGITKVVTVHPEEDMNVCTKLHDSPFNSCWRNFSLDPSGGKNF